LIRFSAIERRGLLLSFGALLFALGFIVFSSGHVWQFAVAGNLTLGLGLAITQVSSTALVAYLTTNEVRGRVMTLLMLNLGLVQLLILPVAALGQAFTLETIFPIMAVACVVLVAAIIVTHPGLWKARIVRAEAVAATIATPVQRLSLTMLGLARSAPNKESDRPGLPMAGGG
ncbi:MAG: hypothetical protein V3V06_05785, partial [Dehalococcoidia bacterium]